MNRFNSVPSYANREVLRRASTALLGIPHIIFFGTLLGVTRDRDLIDGDDDVDIYVDLARREEVLARLVDYDFLHYPKSHPNLGIYFSQFETSVDGYKCHLDIYFYESDDAMGCIRDRWGFWGKVHDERSHLLVPKKLLFPAKEIPFLDFKVSVPRDADGTCIFLYGADWKRPMKKGEGYWTIIHKNRPIQIRRSTWGKLKRRLYCWGGAVIK